MPLYEYLCEPCKTIFEIRHSIKSEETYCCEKCGNEMQKKISCDFYVAGCSLKPTLADMKEDNYKKKIYDKDRARRSRKRAFGSSEVENVRDTAADRHVFKKGRVLAGENKTVDRQDFIKSAAKSDFVVNKCLDVLKKKNGA